MQASSPARCTCPKKYKPNTNHLGVHVRRLNLKRDRERERVTRVKQCIYIHDDGNMLPCPREKHTESKKYREQEPKQCVFRRPQIKTTHTYTHAHKNTQRNANISIVRHGKLEELQHWKEARGYGGGKKLIWSKNTKTFFFFFSFLIYLAYLRK